MLRCREVHLEMNGFTVQGEVVVGSPQGVVLLSSFWNLVMGSVIKKLNHAGLYSLGYADDVNSLVLKHLMPTDDNSHEISRRIGVMAVDCR